jgi:hypothetical protein
MAKVLVLVAFLSGCSVALQAKPNKTATRDCHTTHAYWVADAVLATASVAALSYAIANYGDDKLATLGAGGVTGIVFLASAHNGYKWRGECARGEPAHTD